MTVLAVPICNMCTHLHRDATTLQCDAFPDGIPDAIIASVVLHINPIDGDHGVQFELEPDSALVVVSAHRVVDADTGIVWEDEP